MRIRPLAALLVLALARAASAGNQDAVLLGNEAALTGGTEAAMVSDGSAIWYNPAGLALVDRSTVDGTASAFVLRKYNLPGLLSYATGASADGSFLEIVSVPAALTFVRPIGDSLRAGIGIFVSNANDMFVRTTLDASGGPGVSDSWVFAVGQGSSVNHIGAALAWKASPALRFGFSLFGVYGSERGSFQFWGSRNQAEGLVFTGTTTTFEQKTVGAEARAGLQFEPVAGWRVGASMIAPTLQLLAGSDHTSITAAAQAFSGSDGVAIFQPEQKATLEPVFEVGSSVRVRLGIARTFDAGWVSIEGDLAPAFENTALEVQRRVAWNVRAGGRLEVAEGVTLGAGVFTDRSPEPAPAELGDFQVDFYGLAGGIEYRNTHALRDPGGADSLQFSSTFGLRYAYGNGGVGGLRFNDDGSTEGDEDGDGVSTPILDSTVHEFAFHLGSALYF